MRIHSLLIAAIACILIFGITACAEKPEIRFSQIKSLTAPDIETYVASDKASHTRCVISVLPDRSGIDIDVEESSETDTMPSVCYQHIRLVRLDDGTTAITERSLSTGTSVQSNSGDEAAGPPSITDNDGMTTLTEWSLSTGTSVQSNSGDEAAGPPSITDADKIFRNIYNRAAKSGPLPKWITDLIVDHYNGH